MAWEKCMDYEYIFQCNQCKSIWHESVLKNRHQHKLKTGQPFDYKYCPNCNTHDLLEIGKILVD